MIFHFDTARNFEYLELRPLYKFFCLGMLNNIILVITSGTAKVFKRNTQFILLKKRGALFRQTILCSFLQINLEDSMHTLETMAITSATANKLRKKYTICSVDYSHMILLFIFTV